MKKKTKVAVAMSGGVDSGVAAALSVKAGYECAGFHLHLWAETAKDKGYENKCCSTESLEAARMTTYQLGMPFYTLDFAKIFKKKIVDYFLKEYAAGLTPNPCVMCNKYIKFGELFEYVRKLGFDYLATGHYARIQTQKLKLKTQNYNSKVKTYHLLQALDKTKDQSYFLYNLSQKHLAHILFPVGEFTKKEVRAIAKKVKLPVAERPESQEICFLPENDYRPFLKRHIAKNIQPGEVVDVKGNVIGRHFGLPLYTIGQRHGFELRTNNKEHRTKGIIPPYYVIKKDVKKNQLVVGFGRETERKEFEVDQINPVNLNILISQYPNIFVRIRQQGELLRAKTQRHKDTKIQRVILEEPQRGIAAGQAAVFYGSASSPQAIEVLGGGIIQQSNTVRRLYRETPNLR